MKKFLKTSVLAFSFGLVFYVSAVCITGTIRPVGVPNVPYYFGAKGHMYARLQETPKYKDVEILVLGSSRAYRGLDPRIFDAHNLQMFNLGSSAQTSVQSLYLARRYLDILQPKLVLIEVYPKGFTSDGLESTLDILANDQLNKRSLGMALGVNHIKVYNALIVKVFRNALGIDDHFSQPLRIDDDTYVSGGYVEKDLKYNKELEAGAPRDLDYRPEQVKALRTLVEFIKKRGVEVVLFEAPCSQVRYESIANRKEIEAVHRELAPYVNFNERLHLNDSLHFYDQTHLNAKGVRIFNEALIDWLDEEGYVAKLNNE